MTDRIAAAALAAILLGAMPGWAQTVDPTTSAPGNPATTPAGTPERKPGTPAPHRPNASDQVFAVAAAQAGLAEVVFGKLAEAQGGSDAVRDFGRQMVRDHGKANDRLAELAKAAGIVLPDELNTEHQAIHDRLEGLKGDDFDHAYIATQIADHQVTAQLLEYEIGAGQDEGLKGFAAETLPVVFEHLRMAQGLATEMSAQATAPPVPKAK
jgi:putative membrane protein